MRPTRDPYILQLDVASSDFLAGRAYPTTLYANPYAAPRTVDLDAGPEPVCLYDLTHHRTVVERVTGPITLNLDPQSARVVARVPADATWTRVGPTLEANGVVVDYGLEGGA